MKKITIDRIFYIVFGFIFIFTGVLGYSSWGNHPGENTVPMMIFCFVLFIVGIGLASKAIYIKEEVKSDDVSGRVSE